MTTKKKSVVAAGGAAAVVMAAFAAPGAAASESIDGDVQVSNTETVSVLMDANGSVNTQRVYEQLVLSGRGSVDISNPVSTDGLRNLDGFRGWEVVDGAQRVKTDVNGKEKFRSVASFDGELPVSLDVKYYLDGEPVEAGDVVGERGELEVVYTVINTTGKQQEVTYTDGEGKTKTSTQAVVIPMVGSLTTVLPASFRDVEPVGANAAGDGKGGTQLSFTMTLFPPIGSDRATFGYKAQVEDGVVPKASLSLLPVNPLENASFKGGAESYKGGADKGADLTAGAVTIDENLLKIRDGAADLVDGLLQLRDGSQELNAGLAGKAAPGAGELASGAGQLDAGAKKLAGGTGDLDAGASKLNNGAGQLSEGLKTASAGGPALLSGVQKLKAGAEQVDKGLVTLNGRVTAGGEKFKSDFAASVDGALVTVGDNIDAALTENFVTNVPNHPALASLTPQQRGGLEAVLGGTRDAVVAGIRANLANNLAPQLKGGVNGGVDQLVGGVSVGVGTPGSTVPGPPVGPSLRNGLGQVIGGLGELETKGGELAGGLKQLSAGANQLAAGTGDLKNGTTQLRDGAGQLSDGTGKLSEGAGTLASGLQDAADGSGRLAEGLGTAAEKAPALPEGAEQLSEQGTSQLVNVGNGTAMDFGLKYALIEAGAARAAEAQPYGSPADATALTAYKFDLAAADGQGSANVTRGIAVAILAAAALGLMALRRRGAIG